MKIYKQIIALLLFASLFLPQPVMANYDGDANADGVVNDLDYEIIRTNFGTTTSLGKKAGDLNNDTQVDGVDYVLWLNTFGTTIPSPVPSPIPSPTLSTSKGIWISKEEILKLPTSGTSWDRVNSAAKSDWGAACLYDNNCMHDVNTLAGALVATRLGDSAMRNKVITGLQAAQSSTLSRALELSRGLQSYVIAADIIGYYDPSFMAWVRTMLNADVTPHNGGSTLCDPSTGTAFSCSGVGGIICTAYRSPNNWGGHARASVAAAAIYLGDTNLLNQVANAQKAFIGVQSPNHLYCDTTNWHSDSAHKAGINRAGSLVQGVHLSGVLPEDWRRGAEFTWLPTTSTYMWEGMQGYVVTSVILHRAGLVNVRAGDNALVRSMDMLYGQGEAALNNPIYKYPAASDDTWIPWVVNYYAGTSYPTTSSSPGKGMGWTDWTNQR